MRQINIKFSNRALYTLMLFLLIGLLGVVVYAFGGNSPNVVGHSVGEMDWSETIPSLNVNSIKLGSESPVESWPAGPKGDKGDTGDQGIQGIQGSVGPAGAANCNWAGWKYSGWVGTGACANDNWREVRTGLYCSSGTITDVTIGARSGSYCGGGA
jgi:hypothetical protein